MAKNLDSTLPNSGIATANAHTDKASLPNLDGIRAFACLVVVFSHMPLPIEMGKRGITGYGEVAVGMFFVLSGFLMTYLYGRESWNLTAVCRYSIARFSRIAPIYWLVISTCVLISYIQPNDEFSMRLLGATSIVRHYLFSGNVSIFWTIPLEVQYYILFPLIWWGIAHRTKISFALPLTALVCSGLLLTHAFWPNLSLPSKMHFFLAGSIAGLMPRGLWSGSSNRSALIGLQIGALCFLILPPWLYPSKPLYFGAVEVALALAVVVYLFSFTSRWTALVFATPLIRRIGQASLSIYLMHGLVFHYGIRWLGLTHDSYDPLWVVLCFAGVALPMLVSRGIEIPIQKKTRRYLESALLPIIGNMKIASIAPEAAPSAPSTK